MNFGQVRIMEEVSLAIAAIIAIVFGILLETGLSASMIPNKKWWKIINVSAIFVCIASLLLSIGSLIYEIRMQSVYNKRGLVPLDLDDSGILVVVSVPDNMVKYRVENAESDTYVSYSDYRIVIDGQTNNNYSSAICGLEVNCVYDVKLSGIDPSNGNCPTTVIYIEKENLKIVL
jgi:hypothetical protein